MISSRFLILHNENTENWADRFGLRIVSAPCDQCNTMVQTTIPFIYKTYRGLKSPPCPSCGNIKTPYCIVRDPKYGDLFSEIEETPKQNNNAKIIEFKQGKI